VRQAYESKHVLDLFARVEAGRTDQTIGNVVPDEALLQRARLCVGAVHNGDVAMGVAASQQPERLFGNEIGLFLFVVGLVEREGLTAFFLREQVFGRAVGVLGNDRLGSVEDNLGRPVVLLQQKLHEFRKVLSQAQNVAVISTTPGVDRLILVGDHIKAAMVRSKLLKNDVLGDIRVLELIDQDVLEAVPILMYSFGICLEHARRFHQEVVEVEPIVLAQRLLVLRICPRYDLIEIGAHRVICRQDQLILCRRNRIEQSMGPVPLVVQSHIGNDLLHHGELVVSVEDQEIRGESQPHGFAPQDPRTGRVERTQHHSASRRIAQHRAQTMVHLASCLVGEGHSQDLPGRDVHLRQHPGDPMGKHACLARPGAGQNQSGPHGGRDSSTLLVVETV